jgi:hypothetical protein
VISTRDSHDEGLPSLANRIATNNSNASSMMSPVGGLNSSPAIVTSSLLAIFKLGLANWMVFELEVVPVLRLKENHQVLQCRLERVDVVPVEQLSKDSLSFALKIPNVRKNGYRGFDAA